jgi:hypothetical protein
MMRSQLPQPQRECNARRTLDESFCGGKKNIAPSQNIFIEELNHFKLEQERPIFPVEFLWSFRRSDKLK